MNLQKMKSAHVQMRIISLFISSKTYTNTQKTGKGQPTASIIATGERNIQQKYFLMQKVFQAKLQQVSDIESKQSTPICIVSVLVET